MSEMCHTCGLPKELCVCETIAKEVQRVSISRMRKKFGKIYTIIDGIDNKSIDLKALTKKLKNVLACGGTVKGTTIELQGDHLKDGGKRVKTILTGFGFTSDTIDVRQGFK